MNIYYKCCYIGQSCKSQLNKKKTEEVNCEKNFKFNYFDVGIRIDFYTIIECKVNYKNFLQFSFSIFYAILFNMILRLVLPPIRTFF